MIREIEIFDSGECSEIISKVHELETNWIRRVVMAPFFTLAAASYLDAVWQPHFRYYPVAKETNEILWNQFHQIYDRLLRVLSETLKAPAQFVNRFALPGFHIFQGHPAFTKHSMSVHFDLQYQLLEWENKISDYATISFTVPITLPKAGAGLWHWDLTYKDIDGLPQDEKEKLIESHSKSYYAYKDGVMMLHSGHELHQIATLRDFYPGEERITLQGHGLLVDGTWQIYW